MAESSVELTYKSVGQSEDLVRGKFSSFNLRANRRLYQELVTKTQHDNLYITALEDILRQHNIELPPKASDIDISSNSATPMASNLVMEDGTVASLEKVISQVGQLHDVLQVDVQFRDMSFWGMVPVGEIPTVGSTVKHMFCGSGPKQRLDILKDLTGRIQTGKMTLVMGPPGCGKSSFLKALSGQLYVGSNHLDGFITYNGDAIDSGKYLVSKLADYIDQRDQHAPTLTVRETLEFAWTTASNGHHSYAMAKDAESAAALDSLDESKPKIENVMQILGIAGVADTIVGDSMLRGVSGGQKRRVTVGEMLLPPRMVKYMDAISNGLDASTTLDIIKSFRYISTHLKMTPVVSLLQPAPEVFDLFDELILMSEGEIVYQGPTSSALNYFQGLGYICPPTVDLADFLQELPTPEGKRFIQGENVPNGTTALVEAYKNSSFYVSMLEEMDVALETYRDFEWPAFAKEPYACSLWKSTVLCLERQVKLTRRDADFLKGRAVQVVVIGSVTGSLFNNLEKDDVNSMNGMLFFSVLFVSLASMALLPIIFDQREVFYKHSRAKLFPTFAFTVAQTVVLIPVQVVETIIFSAIVYWSVGMSSADYGARFLTFILVVFGFSLTATQLFRLIASFMPSAVTAQPLAGVMTVLMVLFSGYIVPKNNIPPGWIWFYWINPLAWAIKSITVNEYLAKDYDFDVCVNFGCTQKERFGDVALESRGNPTEEIWIWYGVIVVYLSYVVLVGITGVVLNYVRVEATPPPPIKVSDENDSVNDTTSNVEIPYDPVTFAFKNVFYTVTLHGGEELDLLQGVSGFFEPGMLTALMGSSGAGKTTLLDVLAGRKNTGVIKGDIYVNGKPKNEHTFRRMMGYVEQFDTLSPRDTAREAVEFSAGLRLPRETPPDVMANWVDQVLRMLELIPLQNTLVGSPETGGMSFEQKKRLSIAVELVANPAILFLDEPTSGLDSRAAQVVIRCIRRVAESGRSIVCTIHQPSVSIFTAFDSLLLLRRGGRTVFNGELGENCEHLIDYFQGAPGVAPIHLHQNPATWMLEVIGAGTGSADVLTTDFHEFYKQSVLCGVNSAKVDLLCSDTSDLVEDAEGDESAPCRVMPVFHCKVAPTQYCTSQFNATYFDQCKYVMRRAVLSYWRSPSYNFIRMITSIIIALIFASTFADQNYDTDVDVMSRCAVMFITILFCGVVVMMSVQPVMFGERPSFYREQFSDLYDVRVYAAATGLVEVPYLIVSSLLFTIPFFFIVGFDKDGVTEKFMWYWTFQALYMSTLVFLGQFFAALTPDAATAQVLSGMASTFISLFGGFMLRSDAIPTFWIFVYWLDPLHYSLEGLFMTQFHRDDTRITTLSGQETTAQDYVETFFSDWSYKHRYGDAIALLIFIVVLR